jgi:hypothetical protein
MSVVFSTAPCVCNMSPAVLEPGHEVVLPANLEPASLIHVHRLAGLTVDDLDGLEEGARVALQDAVANGVLNVGPFKDVGAAAFAVAAAASTTVARAGGSGEHQIWARLWRSSKRRPRA